MTSNNPINFNISKSNPTTSTTNTTTTSAPASSSSIANESTSFSHSGSNAPFLQNILVNSASKPSISTSKPSTGNSSDLAPTILMNSDDNNSYRRSNTYKSNTDLIGLFDKFDISKKSEEKEIYESEKIDKELSSSTNDEEKEHLIDLYKITKHSKSLPDLEKEIEDENEKGTNQVIKSPSEPFRTLESEEVNLDISIQKESDSEKISDLTDLTDDMEDERSTVEEYVLSKEDQIEAQVPQRPIQNSTRTDSFKSISDKTKKVQKSINPEEQYQESHKPFDFQNFLGQLKRKSADPVVRYIRSFLVSFMKQANNLTSEQKIKVIVEFKDFMNEKFSMHEPFASMDDLDLENSREGLEKLIMNRLYDKCFPPAIVKQNELLSDSFKNDLKEDELFSTTVEKFSWVNGSHLDIDLDYLTNANKDSLDFIDYAVNEFSKINKYRAPRDKIICILNSCKIIFSFLKISHQETNADSFIPLLILVIIKAKVDNAISNIHYIENFRGSEWLSHGETSYYLSSLQGAVGFVMNMSFEDLTISEDEYNAHMEAWEAERLRQRKLNPPTLVEPQPIHQQTDLVHEGQPSLSPSNVLMTSAEMFTKSISNFLSPSPDDQSQVSQNETTVQQQSHNNESDEAKGNYSKLRDIFPDLDKAILKDIISMTKGDFDQSLDACLQLMNDV